MAVLRLYRLIAFLAAPLLRFRLRQRAAMGKEDPSRIEERFGHASVQRPNGDLIWVHAASVGETNSILPLIDDLLTQYPNSHILLTTGTVTSAEIIAAHQNRQNKTCRRLIHQFAALDRSAWVKRFLAHWRPQAALWVESEIWPNMVLACAARDLQPVMVNGRISPRSFKRWRRFAAAAKHLLGKYALLTAQDEMSATRLQQLGLENVIMPGNLKLDAPPLPVDAARLAELQSALTGRPIWLAASTHPGEEEQILEAHHMIAETVDNLMTVIVPRHPERGDAIAEMLRRGHASFAQRSKGETMQAHHEIYLMDTLGEMGLAYRLADIAFIGGTLVPHGGQNPFEAAQLDCAILHGPHIANFETLFDDLAAKGAAAEVTDAATLATQVNALFNNRAAIDQMSASAKQYSATMGGVRQRMVDLLAPFMEGQNG
ncbi:MAG: 3-deoxy-D-manno-octulosonic acid transferase [Parvibaculales bacterium]